MLEHVQFLDNLLQTIVLIPDEIESELTGLLILQIHFYIVISCNLFGNNIQQNIVQYDGF